MWDCTTSPGVITGERVFQPASVTADAPRGVWVVVVNYNTAGLLERCLEALRASSLDRPCTVIVVDNGSRDGSVELVRERFPEVLLLQVGRNIGFARANNLALRRVLALVAEHDRGGHAVLLLNSDCFVEPHTIQRLVAVLDSEPGVAVAGPKLVLQDGRLDLACRRSFPSPGSAFWKLTGLASLFPRSRWLGRYNLTFLDPDTPADVDAVSGACMLVRLSAIAEAGLWTRRILCMARIWTGPTASRRGVAGTVRASGPGAAPERRIVGTKRSACPLGVLPGDGALLPAALRAAAALAGTSTGLCRDRCTVPRGAGGARCPTHGAAVGR